MNQQICMRPREERLKPNLPLSRNRLCLYLSVLLSLSPIMAAKAAPPRGAVVVNATTNSNITVKRPDGSRTPVIPDQSLRNRDAIIVPAKSSSQATIRTIGPNLEAKLFGLSKRTLWKLPCEASGSGFIAWGSGIEKGCTPPGVVIRGDLKNVSAVPSQAPLVAGVGQIKSLSPQLAQLTQFFRVCSATNENGDNAQTIVLPFFANPCTLAMLKCEQAEGESHPCLVLSEGEWTSSRSKAFVLCGEIIQKLKDKDALLAFLNSLVGQSTNCTVQVLSPGDALLIPESSNKTAVAFENDGSGAIISVIEGSVKIVYRQSDGWVTLSSGDTYFAENGQRQPTRDWLSRSELCSSLQSSNTVQDNGKLIASATIISQVEAQLETRTEYGESFGSLYAEYCGQ